MKVLYFAWVRETVGTSEEEIEQTDAMGTVGALVASLKQKDNVYATVFADDAMVRAAVNQEYVNLDHPLSNSDEVAFFPPVTGG